MKNIPRANYGPTQSGENIIAGENLIERFEKEHSIEVKLLDENKPVDNRDIVEMKIIFGDKETETVDIKNMVNKEFILESAYIDFDGTCDLKFIVKHNEPEEFINHLKGQLEVTNCSAKKAHAWAKGLYHDLERAKKEIKRLMNIEEKYDSVEKQSYKHKIEDLEEEIRKYLEEIDRLNEKIKNLETENEMVKRYEKVTRETNGYLRRHLDKLNVAIDLINRISEENKNV